MQITFLAGMFFIIILYEVPRLIKDKMWRELIVFSVLMLFGMTMAYAQVLDLPIPNPTNAIIKVFKPVSMWVDKILS